MTIFFNDKFFLRIYIVLLVVFCFIPKAWTQSSHQKRKTAPQLAHEKKGNKSEFTPTIENEFKVKLFSIAPPRINKTHHWFLQIVDKNDTFVNFGNVVVNGYHKKDKNKKFNYYNSVTKLCSEGKYVIGFVKVKHSGTWVLDITINNFEKKDTITLEMDVTEE